MLNTIHSIILSSLLIVSINNYGLIPAETSDYCRNDAEVVCEEPVEEVVETEEKNIITLPSIENNSFKTYMDYRMITDTSSKQWEMQQSAYTDENGLRKIDDYYCVALGSGISDKLGNKFKITFESGETIKVIAADQKADRHTDSTNTYMDLGNGRINIVEFIVHTEKMPSIVRTMGDVSYMPDDKFYGNIVEMEAII